jgi:hypothetical protein
MARRSARSLLLLSALLACACLALARAQAADDLRLAPQLSFTDDSSSAFPIDGNHLDDAAIGKDRGAVLFFGASHCFNTNREAERLVAVYPRFRDRLSFVVVDVGNPSDAQRPLLAKYYRGSIPTVVVLSRSGALLHADAGETARERGDTRALEALLTRAAGD